MMIVSCEFKPQDLWIGVYWKTDGDYLDVWICLLPMLPVRISLFRKDR